MIFNIRQLPLTLIFVGIIGNLTFFSMPVKAQSSSMPSQSKCVMTPEAYISPNLMANMAYRGTYSKEGIPGYQIFISEYNSGHITATQIVQAAMKACFLSDQYDMANQQKYIEAVDNQIKFLVEQFSR